MYLRSRNTKNGPAHSPYYIGKGRGNRFKHSGKDSRIKPLKDNSNVRFIQENLSNDDAILWEAFWIAEFGRIDLGTGCLRNLTGGGEGTEGRIQTESTKSLISEKKKGAVFDEKHRSRISDSKKGKAPWNKGRKETRPDVLENQRNGHLNKSDEEKERLRKNNAEKHTGKTHSEKTKKQMSEKKKGKVAHNKGVKMPIIICPHCNKSGGSGAMKKYHFDRCKFKKVTEMDKFSFHMVSKDLYVYYKDEYLAVFRDEDQFFRADEYIKIHGHLAEWTYQKLSTKRYQNWSDSMKI